MVLPLLVAAIIAPQDQAIALNRVNKAGEVQKYKVLSHLQIEQKQIGMENFLPEDVDLNYDFTIDVKKEKADGIVEALYKRPNITEIDGETADHGSITHVEKLNWLYKLDLSPINKLIAMEDQTPKEKEKPKSGSGGLRIVASAGPLKPIQGDFIGQFIGELHRLAIFIGSIDSSMDFQPKLPLFEVNKGDTWKETVSYSPQKLNTKGGKTVMQRLDYVYTYGGIVESNGVKVYRITSTLNMNADMAQFIKDNIGQAAFVDSGLKDLNFNLSAKIDYDLDLATRKTLRAEGTSTGGFKIVVTQYPEDPVIEQKLKGRTVMTLQK
jgi:hypothetical protein